MNEEKQYTFTDSDVKGLAEIAAKYAFRRIVAAFIIGVLIGKFLI